MSEVRMLQAIWFAFLMTQVLFALIVFGGMLPPPPSGDPMMAGLLAMPAAVTGGFGLIGVPMMLREMGAQQAFMVRFACAESIGVFGVVAHMIGGTMPVVAAYLGIAFGLLVIMRPTEESYTAWEVRRM